MGGLAGCHLPALQLRQQFPGRLGTRIRYHGLGDRAASVSGRVFCEKLTKVCLIYKHSCSTASWGQRLTERVCLSNELSLHGSLPHTAAPQRHSTRLHTGVQQNQGVAAGCVVKSLSSLPPTLSRTPLWLRDRGRSYWAGPGGTVEERQALDSTAGQSSTSRSMNTYAGIYSALGNTMTKSVEC